MTLKERWAEQERAFKEKVKAMYELHGDKYPYHDWATYIDGLRGCGYKERDLDRLFILRPNRLATDQDWKGLSGEYVLALLALHDPQYNWFDKYNGKYKEHGQR